MNPIYIKGLTDDQCQDLYDLVEKHPKIYDQKGQEIDFTLSDLMEDGSGGVLAPTSAITEIDKDIGLNLPEGVRTTQYSEFGDYKLIYQKK